MLIDFGAARQAIGRSSKSVTGLVTPGYSPPEQYAIRSDRYGTWTDIYALGAVLYRCISGASPVEAAERLIDDSLIAAQECGAGRYKPELLAVVDKALALRPEDRYQSVAEIWHDMKMPATLESSDAAVIGKRDDADGYGDSSGELKPEGLGLKSPGAGARQPSMGRIAAMVAVLTVSAVALLWVPIRSVFIPTVNNSVVSSDNGLSDSSSDRIPGDPIESKRVFTSRNDEVSHSIDETTLNNVVLAPVTAVEPNAPDELAKGLLALNAAKGRESPRELPDRGLELAATRDVSVDTFAFVESELEKLLRLGRESLDADRLTTPYDDNALTYFEQALKLDPDNYFAHEGIAKIVQRYVELAKREMDKPDYVKAHRFIARGLVIDANSEQLLEIERQLDALVSTPFEIVDTPAPLPEPAVDLETALNPDSR